MELNLFSMWNEIKKKHPMLQSAETGLLGKQTTTLPGQDTNRSGGIFGYGGTMDQSLKFAGGQIGDYTQGEYKAVSPPSTYGTHREQRERPGFEHSKAKEHLDTGMEGLYETMKWGVEKTDEGVNKVLDWAFPNAPWMKDKLNKEEKNKLESMVKSGKVDHGFVQALKAKSMDNKDQPANDSDIGTLEKFTGVSKEDAMKNWKDKGGFEGLMSNPAFTLGLALMQSSAQGKSIGEDVMNTFIKGAKLSEHYKDRLEARTKVLGPPTQDERDLAAGALQSIGISGPGKLTKGWDFVKLWGKDNTAAYNAGLNKIIIKAKAKIKKKYKYKTHQITEQDYIDAFNEMKNSGEIKDISNIFGVGFEEMKNNKTKKKSKIQELVEGWFGSDNIFTRAEGGPIAAGQPYLVGEKGPEIVVPKQDGEVLSNDNSQIFAMLLAANPQLNNVSRARAEAILKSRFPDYFA
tara:strand:+ start:966 stop:2348 length:1383 start_codon:yes stop_codon:yes gene_type:complete